jgi:hypothetical protein
MIINRNNYEEFFLMYVDDELNTQQRAEVEMFVQQNADLRSEFEMLLQTKLDGDEEVEFAHKTELLKIKDSIGLDNYREYFLLYIDNELNESSREAVETFVLQHPQLQDEFTLLKQTVLPQEKIHFYHKKSLYRKEERRVVYFNWTRIAVAAALIGATALVWRIASDINHPDINVANVQQSNATTKPATSEQINKDTVQQFATPSPKAKEEIASSKPTQQENKQQVAVRTEKKKTVKPVENKIQKDNSDIAVNEHKKTNDPVNITQQQTIADNKNQVATNNKNDFGKSNPIIAELGDNNQPKESDDPMQRAKSTNAVNTKTPKDIIQPAVYKELNTDDVVSTDDGLYIGNMELNKNQVRGILKKVGGLFSGKSKKSTDGKGKLKVASFELNTN